MLVLDGRLFTEADQLFLQSRLRGFRRNDQTFHELEPVSSWSENERFEVDLGNGSKLLQSGLPAIDVTFPPRVLSYAQLDEIDDVFETGRPAAFSVQPNEDGDWLQIDSFIDGPSGYIKTNPEASDFLHERLPELDFLNGLLGFLRLQQAESGSESYPPPPAHTSMLSHARLGRYIVHSSGADETESRALAHVLIGVLSMKYDQKWSEASEHFKAAVSLAPYNSDYQNVLGMIDAYICCAGLQSTNCTDPAEHFTNSLSLQPDNFQAMQSLDGFLDFLIDMTPDDTSTLLSKSQPIE